MVEQSHRLYRYFAYPILQQIPLQAVTLLDNRACTVKLHCCEAGLILIYIGKHALKGVHRSVCQQPNSYAGIFHEWITLRLKPRWLLILVVSVLTSDARFLTAIPCVRSKLS